MYVARIIIVFGIAVVAEYLGHIGEFVELAELAQDGSFRLRRKSAQQGNQTLFGAKAVGIKLREQQGLLRQAVQMGHDACFATQGGHTFGAHALHQNQDDVGARHGEDIGSGIARRTLHRVHHPLGFLLGEIAIGIDGVVSNDDDFHEIPKAIQGGIVQHGIFGIIHPTLAQRKLLKAAAHPDDQQKHEQGCQDDFKAPMDFARQIYLHISFIEIENHPAFHHKNEDEQPIRHRFGCLHHLARIERIGECFAVDFGAPHGIQTRVNAGDEQADHYQTIVDDVDAFDDPFFCFEEERGQQQQYGDAD